MNHNQNTGNQIVEVRNPIETNVTYAYTYTNGVLTTVSRTEAGITQTQTITYSSGLLAGSTAA